MALPRTRPRAALNDLQAAEFDPQTQSSQALKIQKIYRQRIQGKYKGEVAQQVEGMMAGLERRTPSGP